MKQHFECELCGTLYPNETLAQLCESQLMLPPKYKEGDKVLLESRYDGIVEATIVKYEGIRPRNTTDSLRLLGCKRHIHFYEITPPVQFAPRDPAEVYISEAWVYNLEDIS